MTLEFSFSKVLKSLRSAKRMSQEELSFRSDLDRTYISMLERGIYQPTLTTIFALSKSLDITPSELIKLVENEYDEVHDKE
ncbi:helix-turn-helix domain-containing protein [Paenibacillus antibioticophila]|uniref:helix-turn-helix domain-containing protein n=1 Tax=Paenibacillus antibioticophila TaxID=1274374 RepID=UPI0005C83BE3|nr:helix-turn-helix transcriptional regulator [Paenibacillus antibioticophila]